MLPRWKKRKTKRKNWFQNRIHSGTEHNKRYVVYVEPNVCCGIDCMQPRRKRRIHLFAYFLEFFPVWNQHFGLSWLIILSGSTHTHNLNVACCAVQNVCRFWFGMAGLSLCFIPFPFPCHRKTPWWSIVYVPNLWINCCPSMFKFLII